MISQSTSVAILSARDRVFLALPMLAAAFFGIAPLLFTAQFARVAGYSGHDMFVYQLAGAATFGYTVAIFIALIQRKYAGVRLLASATLTFNLVSLLACALEYINGTPQPVVYLITAASILFVVFMAVLLATFPAAPQSSPDIAPWVVGLIGIATVLAAIFGVLPLFVSPASAHLFGLQGTDAFVFRQAGAATLGYAVMGVLQLRARVFAELREPLIMAAVFNGLSGVAGIANIIQGHTSLLVILVTPVALAITVALVVAFARKGR